MKTVKEIKCLMMLMKTAKCLYCVRKLTVIAFFAVCTCMGIKAVSSGKLKIGKLF